MNGPLQITGDIVCNEVGCSCGWTSSVPMPADIDTANAVLKAHLSGHNTGIHRFHVIWEE